MKKQSYKNFELIVVDDGSNDATAEVVAEHPSAKYIFQENQGVSSARNLGIQNSSGEYIAFCDSDDEWHRHKLQKQIHFFQQFPMAKVCYTDEIWIRRGKRVNPCKHHHKVSGDIFEESLHLCLVSPSSVMMHRSFFEQVGYFDETLPACEDYDLWLRAAIHFPFHCIPELLITKYGGHEDQLSQKYWGMDRFRIQVLEKCLHFDLSESKRDAVMKVLTKKCQILAKGASKRGLDEEAEKYLEVLERCKRIKQDTPSRDKDKDNIQ